MKRIVALVLVLLILPVVAGAEISTDKLDSLSEAERTILLFNVGTAIAKKETGEGGQKYSYHLDMDLMKLPLEELFWLYDYLNGETDLPYDGPQEDSALLRHGIEIEASEEQFTSDNRLVFCLFSTVSDVCRQLGLATQSNNPEISFDPQAQDMDFARFYVTYYGEGSKEDAREVVEDYTDVLIEALRAAYPSLQMETLVFCWKIPAIDPNSLYSAMFWCEKDGDVIVRGEGSGAAYQ